MLFRSASARRMCPALWQLSRGRGDPTSCAADLLINLETLNYILAGIQVYHDTDQAWDEFFWKGFGLDEVILNKSWACMNFNANMRASEEICTHIVKNCIRPFGVVTYAEWKGSAAAGENGEEHVSIIVDGEVDRLSNYWLPARRRYPVSPGNECDNTTGCAKKNEQGNLSSSSRATHACLVQPGENLTLMLQRTTLKKPSLSPSEHHDVAPCSEDNTTHAGIFHLPWPAHKQAVSLTFPDKFLPFHACPVGKTGHTVQTTSGPRGNLWQLVPRTESVGDRECWDRLGYWHVGVTHDSSRLWPSAGEPCASSVEAPSNISREFMEECAERAAMKVSFCPMWTSGFKNVDEEDRISTRTHCFETYYPDHVCWTYVPMKMYDDDIDTGEDGTSGRSKRSRTGIADDSSDEEKLFGHKWKFYKNTIMYIQMSVKDLKTYLFCKDGLCAILSGKSCDGVISGKIWSKNTALYHRYIYIYIYRYIDQILCLACLWMCEQGLKR